MIKCTTCFNINQIRFSTQCVCVYDLDDFPSNVRSFSLATLTDCSSKWSSSVSSVRQELSFWVYRTSVLTQFCGIYLWTWGLMLNSAAVLHAEYLHLIIKCMSSWNLTMGKITFRFSNSKIRRLSNGNSNKIIWI